MRRFEYFLFENFDADEVASNPANPRRFLGKETDEILSEIAQTSAGNAYYDFCCERFGVDSVSRLIDAGVLRREGENVLFDSPVFLREDAGELQRKVTAKAASLVDLLEESLPEIRLCCSEIKNGFTVEQNLYHILCGMVFDGRFFDYLSDRGVLAVSKQHSSGLDFLIVIYEKSKDLQSLSDGLLCSYNRFVSGSCSLQSFGDAQGDRFDFYRFFRLLESGAVPVRFKVAEALLLEGFGGADKNTLLSEAVSLVRTGRCSPAALALLTQFGYARDGAVCVPVYTYEHRKQIMEIEKSVEFCLGDAMAETLRELADSIKITAVKHGVDGCEIANELYHIVFGCINEELVSREIVAAPSFVPGEGRYSKCIELYG